MITTTINNNQGSNVDRNSAAKWTTSLGGLG